jgi:hypothetical protein
LTTFIAPPLLRLVFKEPTASPQSVSSEQWPVTSGSVKLPVAVLSGTNSAVFSLITRAESKS